MPDWKQEIRRRLANLQLAPTREAAIVEELAQHLDESYAELLVSFRRVVLSLAYDKNPGGSPRARVKPASQRHTFHRAVELLISRVHWTSAAQ
jgi:hypothetical protein